jgi:type III restriction enzyme
MPGAKCKTQQELNEAYAFVTSSDFQATVESLRDGLVKNGFERQEVKDLLNIPEEPVQGDLFTHNVVVTFTAPELLEPEAIPDGLANKIDIVPETGSITLKGYFTPKQADALESVFQTKEGKEAIREAITRLRTPQKRREKAPSENGEIFRIPLLAFRQGELGSNLKKPIYCRANGSCWITPVNSAKVITRNPNGRHKADVLLSGKNR